MKNEKFTPVKPEFYARDTVTVARELLGKVLVHKSNGHSLAGMIVETEAYLGKDDPASHAARNKTPRNAVMFGTPGRAYVYFIYGNHFCFNVVAHNGYAGAVLIRALEPLRGIAFMRQRRKIAELKNLTNGPGKLTQALGITKDCNGLDLRVSKLQVADFLETIAPAQIIPATRIGIREGLDKLYRFYLKDNIYVSRP
jgi:DNA-3-methyladenine glycosylase